jgi:hypothetical protein
MLYSSAAVTQLKETGKPMFAMKFPVQDGHSWPWYGQEPISSLVGDYHVWCCHDGQKLPLEFLKILLTYRGAIGKTLLIQKIFQDANFRHPDYEIKRLSVCELFTENTDRKDCWTYAKIRSMKPYLGYGAKKMPLLVIQGVQVFAADHETQQHRFVFCVASVRKN